MENPTFKEVFMSLSLDELMELILQRDDVVDVSFFTEADAIKMNAYFTGKKETTDEQSTESIC